MRCEICDDSDDLSPPDGYIDERLLVNYHPAVLCTKCTRDLSNNLCRRPDFVAYQALLDTTEAQRNNKSLTLEQSMMVNSKYCEAVALAGRVMCELIQQLAQNKQ